MWHLEWYRYSLLPAALLLCSCVRVHSDASKALLVGVCCRLDCCYYRINMIGVYLAGS